MSTIRDVARRAGVSTMTVSRVINRSGYTSHETRTRVERAIADLGYVPNAVARHLRSKRTKTIALVLSDITNPFFTTIARGVEDVAGPRGFGVMFCNTDESASEEISYLHMLIQRQVDGVLLVPAGRTVEPLRLLREQGVPVVVVDRRVSSRQVDQVRTDSVGGGHRLTPPDGSRAPTHRDADWPAHDLDLRGSRRRLRAGACRSGHPVRRRPRPLWRLRAGRRLPDGE